MDNILHVELDLLDDLTGSHEDLISNISSTVERNESEFAELMSKVCYKLADRAELEEDSLRVEDVDLTGINGVVSVTYDWGASYPCKDMCGGDTQLDCWKFKLQGNKIIFDLLMPEADPWHEI